MNKKELIFNYLLKNIDGDGKITIKNVVLAKEFGFTTQTISNIMKSLEGNGMISRDKKTITINKSKLVIDDLLNKRNLNYSKKEKDLLYYMYNVYTKESYENGYEYVCITYKNMKDNTTIKRDTELNRYLTKFVNDGLLEKNDGDYKKKQSNKYKFIFDDISNIDNTNIQKKSNENQINNNNELLEKYNTLLSLYEQLNKRVEYLEKEHNQQHTDNIDIDIDYNDDKNNDTIDDDLLKYLDIETEENNIPNDMTEEEIQEKKQQQEKRDMMVGCLINYQDILIQKIQNINLHLSETDIKVLDKLISKSNALNDCVCIIGVLDTYEKVIYTLPKVTDGVFDCIVNYFSTTNDDTIDRLYQCLI
jgi:DNA-binding Lrp family transcriptional regulator